MSAKTQDVDEGIKALLEKLSEEFEIVKRQGFPARITDAHYRYYRRHDVKIPEPRWRGWAHELGMDAARFESVLKILVNEGFLENYNLSPDYI